MPPDTVSVTLLTQEQCKFCDEAKQILGRLARDFPMVVSTVDLASEDGRAMAVAGGVMFPPGLFLDGEPFGYGRVSERRLRKELARRGR